MIPSSSLIQRQIRFLLLSLDDHDFDSVIHELLQFVDYGSDGSIFLLRTCLDLMNSDEGGVPKRQLIPDLLAAIFRHLLDRPNFSSLFCESLGGTVINEIYLEDLCGALHLSLPEKISLGLALADANTIEMRTSGQNFSMGQIEKLMENPISIDSAEQIQNIIMFLYRFEGLTKYVDSFVQMLSLVDPKESTPLILTPLFSDSLLETIKFPRNLDVFYGCSDGEFGAIVAEMESETSMAGIMKEIGYGCTVSCSHCIEVLTTFSPLTEVTLSRILSAMTRTYTGLENNPSSYSTFCSAAGVSATSELSFFSSWNADVFVESIEQLAPGTDWMSVMECLDHEGFYIPNEGAFSFFMSIYARVSQDPFPLHAVCGSIWMNSDGQLSFLRYAVSATPEIFTFAHSVRKLEHDEELKDHGLANHAWLSIDLLEVLCQLAEKGHAATVRAMLEVPLKSCPEVLLFGISQINTAYNLMQYEVSSAIFPLVVANPMGSIMLNIWHCNPKLVVRGFVEMIRADQGNVLRILDICQELKILPLLLEQNPFSFGIRLAALASQKEYLNLEFWLNEQLNTYGNLFFEECIKFVKNINFDTTDQSATSLFQHSGPFMNAYMTASSTMLKVLQVNVKQITSDHLAEELNRVQELLGKIGSRLQHDSPDSLVSDCYADEIEGQVNSYFGEIFSGKVPVESIIQMLAQFKASSEKREQCIADCMIRNLLEESKHFPRYQEKHLKIVAVLLGFLVKYRLLNHLELGSALRTVLEALRRPTDSKIFAFGMMALEQYLEHLSEFPQYCNHILQISHLRGTHPELVAYIESALARNSSGHLESYRGGGVPSDTLNVSTSATSENSELPLSTNGQPQQQLSSAVQQQGHQLASGVPRATTCSNISTQLHLPQSGQPTDISTSDVAISQNSTIAHPSQIAMSAPVTSSSAFVHSFRGVPSTGTLRPHVHNTGFGTALNIETLVAAAERRDAPVEVPVSDVQDKILFMINNMSTSNVDVKAKEFTEILSELYYPWFAQYMVMKRASIEPNFHDLYLKFLEKVNSKALNREIVKAAYENCKVLLRSELIKSSSEERSLLKNLGSWLGKFTIGRNQVLLAREIDPKSLIIEAYEKGLMIAVIPFTSKILEPCQSSIAYRPPNPWTMAILSLLSEIYALPNLKMNLKFDIEVLFKNLGIDMKTVKPTSFLKDREREVEGNPDFSNKDVVASQTQTISEINTGIVPALNRVDLPPEIVCSSHPHPGGQLNLLSQYAGGLNLASCPLMEDEKMAVIGVSDRLPSGQVGPALSPYSRGQLPSLILNIGSRITLNRKLASLGSHYYHSVIPNAIESAIKDVMAAVVKRSVAIATQTTMELVLKDFAMEPEETHIHHAAHLMVASLAGSLAHVTCKEPLRASLSSQLRISLQGVGLPSDVLGSVVSLIVEDNVDLGCVVIANAATDKARRSIDSEIAKPLSLRKKHRESIASSIYDVKFYTQGSLGVITESLHLQSGHIPHSQQRVYEDFFRFSLKNQPGQSSNGKPSGSSTSSVFSGALALPGGQFNSDFYAAGPASTALHATQSTELISEEMDPSSGQFFSSSSTHVRGNDVIPHNATNNSVSSLSSAITAPEVHVVGTYNAVKECGGISTILPMSSAVEHVGDGISEPSLLMADVLEKYQVVAQKLEALVNKDSGEAEIQEIISQIPEFILKCVNRDEVALAVAQKVFKSLYENASNAIHVSVQLSVLAAIRDVCKLVVKELTSWVIYSDEERKFNSNITVGLILKNLLNLAEYNIHMAKLVDAGRNKTATEFAVNLLQTLVQESRATISEIPNLVDVLAKLASRPEYPESLQQLVEIAKNTAANAALPSRVATDKDDKTKPHREKGSDQSMMSTEEGGGAEESVAIDPPGFREQVSALFREWYQIYELHGTNDGASNGFITQLQLSGYLNGDDISDCFFRLLMEISISHCLSSEMQSSQSMPNLSFLAIDVYTKLVSSVVKYCLMEHRPNGLFLWQKILSVTVRVIQRDTEDKKGFFNPRPYFRLFINWLFDLVMQDHILNGANFQVLIGFANAFHALQPLKVPAFSFAWLELVSHRSFMPKLLSHNAPKSWIYVQRLLVDLFKFMEPYLRNAELREPICVLYKGTLRVLLVLLHDFPEFLCNYHFSFCDVIPPSCIQMRNIILSTFPRNMRLPDPNTPNLKIDLLPDIYIPPHILSEVDAALKSKQMKSDVDEYLKTRNPVSSFLSDMKQRLMLPQNEAAQAGTCYNVPLINSLVLYIGMQTVQQLQTKATPPHVLHMSHSSSTEQDLMRPALDIFQALITGLDTEGRYLLLNAIANQLRYPNNHTHLFSFAVLYLFNQAAQEIIQEQITRVLVERLMVNKPHPWGLLVTFTELVKNPSYKFWNCSFTRGDAEIERLFESVARSCGVSESMLSGKLSDNMQ